MSEGHLLTQADASKDARTAGLCPRMIFSHSHVRRSSSSAQTCSQIASEREVPYTHTDRHAICGEQATQDAAERGNNTI